MECTLKLYMGSDASPPVMLLHGAWKRNCPIYFYFKPTEKAKGIKVFLCITHGK